MVVEINEYIESSMRNCNVSSGSILKRKTSSRPSRRVSFDCVNVREYDRCIGDNPSCRSGPPVSLDWQYSTSPTKTIDDFELERAQHRVRFASRMVLSKYTRRNILTCIWGYAEEEMKAATRQVKVIRRQRALTEAFMVGYMAHECISTAFSKICKGSNDSQPDIPWCDNEERPKHQRQNSEETTNLSDDSFTVDAGYESA